MKILILTLFPSMFSGFLEESIVGRAIRNKKISVEIFNLRDWGLGKHKQVDDTPYGGGAGMVLKVDVVAKAISSTISKYENKAKGIKPRVILLTPQGQVFNQQKAQKIADEKRDLLLICGHYEGFDERIRDYVDEEISIGDFVLTGGELAAAVIIDAISRLVPGVLGKEESHKDESFSNRNSLEYPHYTRPEDYDGKKVPDILLSGHHAEIEKWRNNEALKRTQKRRPDLLK